MATYTLYDGSKITGVPDGLDKGQVENLIAARYPWKAAAAGVFYDQAKDYDMTSGVGNQKLRFDLASARGNPKEIALILNDQVGRGNWGVTDYGSLFITPEGARTVGEDRTDNRNVLVDGIGFDMYDLTADIVPELSAFGGIVAGEGAPAILRGISNVPGVGWPLKVAAAVPGISSLVRRIGSPGLLARNLRGGAGAAGATIGLEQVQALRGYQTDSLDRVLTMAGTEGALIAALGIGMGLPFQTLGTVAGRIGQTAKDQASKIRPMGQGGPVGAADVSGAWHRIRDTMRQNGTSESQIRQIMPFVTLKTHGEANPRIIQQKMMTTLEGIGKKQQGDAYLNRTVALHGKFDSIWRGGEAAGKSTEDIYQTLLKTLSKAEMSQLKKSGQALESFYTGAGLRGDMGVSDLTNLIARNLEAQYRHGQKLFASGTYYGRESLNTSRLPHIVIDNSTLASMVNRMASDLKVTPEIVRDILTKQSTTLQQGSANKLFNNSVQVGTVVPGKLGKGTAPLAKGRKRKKHVAGSTAADLANLAKGVRDNAFSKQSITPAERRTSAIASNELNQMLGKVTERAGLKNYARELKEVNKAYAEWVKPHKALKDINFVLETSAQNPAQYVDSLLKGRKKRTFVEVADTLGKTLAGGPVGRAKSYSVDARGKVKTATDDSLSSPALTVDELFGTVGQQYLRWNRDRYGLTREAIANATDIGQIRANAARALKHLDDVANVETTAAWRNASGKIVGLPGMELYKKTLREIAAGDKKGIARLMTSPGYAEVNALFKEMSTVGRSLSGGGLPSLATKIKQYKDWGRQVDAKTEAEISEVVNAAMYDVIWKRSIEATGLKPEAASTALLQWSNDIIKANQTNKAALDTLLGAKNTQALTDYALVIRGAHNIDMAAGTISAAGLPIRGLQGAINMVSGGSAWAAARPVTTMFATASFAPGGKAWLELAKRMGYAADGSPPKGVTTPRGGTKTVEEALDKMQPTVKSVWDKSINSANASLIGSKGLFAWGVTEWIEEANSTIPMEGEPDPVPVNEEKAPDPLVQASENPVPEDTPTNQLAALGESIVNMVQQIAANRDKLDVTSSLQEGRDIARSVSPRL